MFSYNREFTASWDKNWDKSYPFDEKDKDKQVFGLVLSMPLCRPF